MKKSDKIKLLRGKSKAFVFANLTRPNVFPCAEKLIDLLSNNPRKRFGLPAGGDFAVWNLSKEFTVNPEAFLSKGKDTPFTGWKLNGECLLTVCDGKAVYKLEE